MKTVLTCNTLPEADLLRSLLESEGITVAVPDEHTPQPIAGFPAGYRVQVEDAAFPRSVEILRDAGYLTTSTPQQGDARTLAAVQPVAPPDRQLRCFRWLIVVDTLLTLAVWWDGQVGHLDLPREVNAYLESLAAADWLWEIGYLVANTAFGFGLIGSLFMLFRARLGLYLFAGGTLVQIAWAWVFPAGIYHGWSGALGAFELVLAGFIIGLGCVRPMWEKQ